MNYNKVNVNVSGIQSIIKALQNYNTIMLKPNIVDNRNVLTQEMMSERHTKYVIRWNYSLEGATINVPEDCIIEFAGGTIDNGTIVGDNTIMIYNKPIDEVCPAERRGTFIYNTTVADEEDITSASGQLKFKDRPATDGMGRKILRKNIVDGVNILTQEMMSDANTIYVIQYDFTLGEDITVPDNCVLKFEGGSISGTHTITGTNTGIQAALVKIFNTDVTISGSWSCVGHVRWFGAHPNNNDNTANIQKILDSFDQVEIDNHTYITDSLTLSKCRVLKGTIVPRGELGTLKFDFKGTSKTGITVQYVPSYPYIQIEGVSFTIQDEDDILSDSICIDLSVSTSGEPKFYSTPIVCKGCRFEYFNIGVKSNYKSYYNYFSNCIFNKINICLQNFSSNNLVVFETLGVNFNYFINGCSGNGPVSITECSFEHFNKNIVYTGNDLSILNFHNNYVEVFNGNVISGVISVLNSTGNDIQVSKAIQKIYYPFDIKSLYSIGNVITVTELDINASDLYDFSYLSIYNNAGSKLENLIIHDTAVLGDDFDISKYGLGVSPSKKNYKTYVEGCDPITGRLFYSRTSSLAPVNGNGYWYSESTPTRNARFKTDGRAIYFAGTLKKTNTVISEGQKNIANLPLDSIGNPDINWTNYQYWNLYIHDSDGNPVILRYYPKEVSEGGIVTHVAGSIDFIQGDTTKDLEFDGCCIIL